MTRPLPKGTLYRAHDGKIKVSYYEGKLIRIWGKRGVKGLAPEALYYIPILGGHVGEYVRPENILDVAWT